MENIAYKLFLPSNLLLQCSQHSRFLSFKIWDIWVQKKFTGREIIVANTDDVYHQIVDVGNFFDRRRQDTMIFTSLLKAACLA